MTNTVVAPPQTIVTVPPPRPDLTQTEIERLRAEMHNAAMLSAEMTRDAMRTQADLLQQQVDALKDAETNRQLLIDGLTAIGDKIAVALQNVGAQGVEYVTESTMVKLVEAISGAKKADPV